MPRRQTAPQPSKENSEAEVEGREELHTQGLRGQPRAWRGDRGPPQRLDRFGNLLAHSRSRTGRQRGQVGFEHVEDLLD